MVVLRGGTGPAVASGISREQESRRRCGEHSRLNARSVAIHFDAAVIISGERRVDFPPHPVSQSQVGPELELVLRVGVISGGLDGLVVSAALQIAIRYAE